MKNFADIHVHMSEPEYEKCEKFLDLMAEHMECWDDRCDCYLYYIWHRGGLGAPDYAALSAS